MVAMYSIKLILAKNFSQHFDQSYGFGPGNSWFRHKMVNKSTLHIREVKFDYYNTFVYIDIKA